MDVVFETDMTCQSCVAKVQPHLDALDTVRSWTTDLSDPRRLVRVTLDDEAVNTNAMKSDVADAIRAAGFHATEVIADGPVEVTPGRSRSTEFADKPTNGFQLSTYGPLFLVVTYVVAATGYVEWTAQGLDASRAMRNFMGFFFLGFAFFKLLNVPKFADAFAGYDVIAKRSRLYALTYPGIEVLLGIMFVFNLWPEAASLATILILGVGLVGVIAAVRRKQTIQCACLGTAFNLPMSVVTIIENSVMIVMAIVMLMIK